jgi:hypothetical protein
MRGHWYRLRVLIGPIGMLAIQLALAAVASAATGGADWPVRR